MLQILSNIMEIKSNTSVKLVPNLKEVETQEIGFHKF